MEIEKIIDKWDLDCVEHLVNYEYESYKEMIECVVNIKGWDDYSYEFDYDDENNYHIIRVWDDDNNKDVVIICMEYEDEDEED